MNETTPCRYAYGWKWGFEYFEPRGSGCLPTSTLIKDNLITWDNTRAGSDLPKWRTFVSQGISATTEFWGFRSFINMTGQGAVHVHWVPNPSLSCYRSHEWMKGDITGVPGHGTFTVAIEPALAKARGKVISKAKELLTPFQGGVALGELGETLRMLRSPGRSLFKLTDSYLTRLKKGERRLSSKERRKHLSDAYLEFQFGWKPLAHDVDGALTALAQLQVKRPFRIVRVAGRGKVSKMNPPYVTNGAKQSLISVKCIEEDFIEESFITRAGVKMKASGSDGAVPQSLGFLPENWLPTAWELLPYSFVADYFANIGNIIDAWSLINGNLAWVNETRRTTRVSKRKAFAIDESLLSGNGGTVESVTVQPCSAAKTSIWVHRYPLGSIVPPLVFRLPGFGSTQSWNLAALINSKSVRRPYY